MAELGTIASGVGMAAFVIQVADQFVQLKSFVDSVREAPEDVKDLLNQMNLLCRLLASQKYVDSLPTSGVDCGSGSVMDSLLMECQQMCLDSAQVLHTTIADLHTKIEKRGRIGSFIAVAKSGTLKRLQSKVGSAIGMVQLAKHMQLE